MNNTDITGTRKSQPRRIVDRKIATVALSRCGQRHLHGEDYLQKVRSLVRRQKKALHSNLLLPSKNGEEKKGAGRKPMHMKTK